VCRGAKGRHRHLSAPFGDRPDPERSRPRPRPSRVRHGLDQALPAIEQKKILTDIDMSFKRGTITALIGPTGSGKSTYIRTLNRMNDRVPGFHRDGDVTLDKESIWHSGINLLDLRRVRHALPAAEPLPMSIRDNVVAGVKAHRIAKGKAARRRLRAASDRSRALGRSKRPARRLPVPALGGSSSSCASPAPWRSAPRSCCSTSPPRRSDPISTEMVEGLVRALTPALTLIVVTHNLAQARRISDVTMFFYDGHLVEHGRRTNLFENPKQEQTGVTSVGASADAENPPSSTASTHAALLRPRPSRCRLHHQHHQPRRKPT